ncbi:Chaperone protein DnaK [Labeo rohita]|uniref:Chaperone protein DnaK n=1 Tax=Labeo rohita TaxID=84645 RepID=A0ABQ8MSY4_LABRO|nr:Chaperone protein DnaK [Labeo rohita]
MAGIQTSTFYGKERGIGHQDHLNVINDCRTEAERILYKIVEGDSDLELSDEERDEDEFESNIQEDVEEEEEIAGD